jgi:hypothetical protein
MSDTYHIVDFLHDLIELFVVVIFRGGVLNYLLSSGKQKKPQKTSELHEGKTG